MENPIKIDVGVSAKAEIKGEVPSSSLGRLVDALTDVIRPFTEHRGLRGDMLRLQREDVMIKIAEKAHQRLALEGLSAQPVPNKILIPLIEKASLCEPDDQYIIERWANLLASASRGASANQSIYVDILSKLDPVHLRYLEFLAQPDVENRPPDEFLHIDADIDAHFENLLSEHINSVELDSHNETRSDELTENCAAFFRRKGSRLIAGGIHKDDDAQAPSHFEEIHGDINFQEYPEFISGALESLNLIERKQFHWNGRIGYHFWIHYHVMTLFGLEFFYAGHIGKNIMAGEK